MNPSAKPEVFANSLVLSGPTASGKTTLSLELAERLNAEIVSMDSMTLYRGMDIGTAKPTQTERDRIRHHLIDVLDPWESSSVAWWLTKAAECCQEIETRGKQVLFVGGTPLYLKALLRGLFNGPAADADLRRRLTEESERDGKPALHQRLAEADPISASRLHPHDVRRVIRALEVLELTGRPMSAWQQQWRASFPTSSRPRCLWLDLPRGELYERINARVQHMIQIGWIEEAKGLLKLPKLISKEARQALGYSEIFDYVRGKADLEETIEHIQIRTRHFAKRQISWFRHLPECQAATRESAFKLWDLTTDQEKNRIQR